MINETLTRMSPVTNEGHLEVFSALIDLKKIGFSVASGFGGASDKCLVDG